MWAWKTDANDLKKGLQDADFKQALDALLPLQTTSVRNFVESQRATESVLVGPKGSGKTFLLAAKSFYLRQTDKRRSESGNRRSIYPADRLFERISGGNLNAVIYERAKFWTKPESWRDAWATTLLAVAFEAADLCETLEPSGRQELRSVFERMYKRDENGVATTTRSHSVSTYLHQVVHQHNDPARRASLARLRSTIIEPALREHQNPILIFIDAPDEAVDAESYDQEQSVSCWLELQLGLLLAIRQIREVKENIVVLTTLRSEVYQIAHQLPLFQQATSNCMQLTYTSDQLRHIFEQNCKESIKDSPRTEGVGPIEQFLGFRKVRHTCVVDSSHNLIEEDAFDVILRHSFHRPRDLMETGKALREVQTHSADLVATFKGEINRLGEQLLSFIKAQAHPPFDDRYLEVLKHFNSNVFSRKVLDHAQREFSEKFNTLRYCPFAYMHAYGLIGIIDSTTNTQKFAIDPKSLYDLSKPIPTSSWYFLHPALNQAMARLHGNQFEKNRSTVCGHGCRVPRLSMIEMVRMPDGKIEVRLEGRRFFSEKTTIASRLLVVIVYAVFRFSKTILSHEEILESASELDKQGWLKLAEMQAQFLKAQSATDHIKPIRKAFAIAGFTPSIRRDKNKWRFLVCAPDLIDVSLPQIATR